MKLIRTFLRVAVLAVAVAHAARSTAAELISSFNSPSDLSGWFWESWSEAGSFTHDANVDAGGGASSGSVRLDNNFSAAPGLQRAVFTFPLPGEINAAALYNEIHFDVKVAPGSSLTPSGDYGSFVISLRHGETWEWSEAAHFILAGEGWIHVVGRIPSGATRVHHISFQHWGSEMGGPVSVHVDNIRWRNSANVAVAGPFESTDGSLPTSALATFDSSALDAYWDKGTTTGTVALDSSRDAGGGAEPGSLRLAANFKNDPVGWQDAWFTLDWAPELSDFEDYIYLNFDVRVDENSSAPDTHGDYGKIEFALRRGSNWDFVTLNSTPLRSTGWRHVSLPIKVAASDVHHLSVMLGGSGMNGPVVLNIDNITLTRKAPGSAYQLNFSSVNSPAEAAVWKWEGPETGVVEFAPLDDADGSGSSGALRIVNNITPGGGTHDSIITAHLGSHLNFSELFNEIHFDVKVAPGSSPRASGDYGTLRLILRDGDPWGWIETSRTLLKGSEWIRVAAQIPASAQPIHHLTFQYGGDSFTGPITLLIDNVVFKNTLAEAPISGQGVISAKEFWDIPGSLVSDLTSSPKFPNQPDAVEHPSLFEWPTSNDPNIYPPSDTREYFGVQILGHFHPVTSGFHSFYISADDQAELYLSGDDNPANKVLIAREPEWNGARNYLSSERRPIADAATGRLVNQSPPIHLVAGEKYYIEAIMKEGIFGENLSVAVVVNNSSIPERPISGAQLSSIDKTSGPVSITQGPLSATVVVGQAASFSVQVQGTPPYSYQWFRDGQPILGATSATHRIPSVNFEDAGQYTVEVRNHGGADMAVSAAAALTVEEGVPSLSLDVRGSFLHASSTPVPNENEGRLGMDSPQPPLIVDLAGRGIVAGDRVRIQHSGLVSHFDGEDPIPPWGLVGLFSASSDLLPPDLLHRVPDALPSELPEIVTMPTHFGSESTDIPHDFLIEAGGLVLRVPNGATHLFLCLHDSHYEDNTGAVAVTIEVVPAVEVPLFAAHESYEYPAGADLSGRDGGAGWHTPWGIRDGGAVVPGDAAGDSASEGSLGYEDAAGRRLVVSGNHGRYSGETGVISQPYRGLVQDVDMRAMEGRTTWISMLIQRTGPRVEGANPYPRAANVSFYEYGREKFAVGNYTAAPHNQISLLHLGGSAPNSRPTSKPFDELSLVVLRIDHLPGNDNAYLFIDPPLGAEPETSQAAAQTIGEFDYTFNSIRPFAGQAVEASAWQHAELLLDEIRIGSTFAEMTPHTLEVTEPSKVIGVTAAATSELGGFWNRLAAHAVNGDYCDWWFWESTGVGFYDVDDRDPAITFDLQAVLPLSHFIIWNSHEDDPAIKRMIVEVSTDGVNFVELREESLALAGGCPPIPQTFSLEGVLARYVRFDILENWAGVTFPIVGAPTAWSLVAIDEVEFYAGTPTAPPNQVPSVEAPLSPLEGAYGDPFSFTFAEGTFSHPTPGEHLAYSASGLPPGINLSNSTFNGTPLAAGQFTVALTATDSDGDLATLNCTITVSKASLTAFTDNATRVYGDPNPVFTGTVTGLKNGDNITVSGWSADQTAPPGTYGIIHILNDPDNRQANYNISYATGTLTVTPAPLLATTADASRVYGDPNPEFTGTVTGLKNGDNITVSGWSADQTAPPGTYGIIHILDDPDNRQANYNISYATGALTVTPAPLLVKTDNATRYPGESNPEFTGTITGLKNADVMSVTGSSAPADSGPGYYPITPALQDPANKQANYLISYVPGVLTVFGPPILTSMTPDWAVAGSAGFAMLLSSPFFDTDATALWAGSPMETLLLNRTNLIVQIPGSAIAGASGIAMVPVTVQHMGGYLSAPQVFTTVRQDVGLFDTAVAQPDGTPALVNGGAANGITPAISATAVNQSGGPLAITAATYQGDPTLGGAMFPAPGGYAGLLTLGADDHDRVSAIFYYPRSMSVEMEESLHLLYWRPDGSPAGGAWMPVLSHGSLLPTKELLSMSEDGSVAGGFFAVEFSAFSEPTVAGLADGPIFGMLASSPKILSLTPSTGTVSVRTPVSLAVSFQAIGAPSGQEISIDWGDGRSLQSPATASGSFAATHAYESPGIYSVTVTVRDLLGMTASAQERVIVFDPAGGWITGGGFFEAPGGSQPSFPAASGSAHFAVTAKHKAGANTVEGNLEFKTGDLQLRASSFDYLVVSGSRAFLQGKGQLSGHGAVAFLLTAQSSGAAKPRDDDRVRMRIWNPASLTVLFDSQSGTDEHATLAPPAQVQGGNVTIHPAR